MPSATTGDRPSSPALTTVAEQFWQSAHRLASVADALAGAPSTALIEAGARSHPRHGGAGDLAAELVAELTAELASLGEKIDALRARLAVPGDGLVPRPERDEAEKAMKALVECGALVDPASFVQRRKVTRQALSKALAAHRVFYVEVEGRRYFPDFFLDPRYERRQVEDVSKTLGELPGTSKLQFFTTQKASLEGRTPLDALAAGQHSRVRTAARGFAER